MLREEREKFKDGMATRIHTILNLDFSSVKDKAIFLIVNEKEKEDDYVLIPDSFK